MENFLEFFAWDPTSPAFWLKIALGAMSGILLQIIAFMLLTPLFIGYLVNRSEGTDPDEKSGFHLFTFLEEGQVKIIVKGDVIVRMIMIYAGHSFARVGEKDSAEYWEVIETPGRSEHPLAEVAPIFRPWAAYVFAITGAVFTGIYPFQGVREYTLERTKIHRDEKATAVDPNDADKGLQGSNLTLESKEDISDHLRTRQFLYPFRIAAADTQDKISVNILLVIKARVKNPHKAAFGTDRWDHQLVNLATNAVTNYTRATPLEEVLSAKSKVEDTDDGVHGINKAVLDIHDDELNYGIDIEGVDLIDISPNLSDVEKAQLYAEALAKPLGAATIIDGESRAKAIRALNEANKAGGEFALATLNTEALVRAAAAAKGGTVILPAGMNAADPVMSAILAELKKDKGANVS